MDPFTTALLTRVVNSLDEPSNFLLDTFFPEVQEGVEGQEEIYFDIDTSKPRITPFVHPMLPGKVVDSRGFETKSFKPAYAKDKRIFKPDRPLKRAIGEKLTGSMSPAQRLERLITQDQMDQLEMLTRRENVMASEALRLGQVTVSGDGFETKVVDFQRDASLTIALAGGARWGEVGVSPYDDLEAWAQSASDLSGAAVRTIVMESKAWDLYQQDPKVEKILDRDAHRGVRTIVEGPQVNGRRAAEKFTYRGTLGHIDFWVGNDTYVDDQGVTRKLLPDYQVIGAAPGRGGLDGVRAYGSILDEKAGFRSTRYFSKSWLEEDPAIRWLLLQSAPLIVPYRPAASFGATVR